MTSSSATRNSVLSVAGDTANGGEMAPPYANADTTTTTTNNNNNACFLDSKHSIQNFRQAAGIPSGIIIRCASTDVLGAKMKLLDENNNNNKIARTTTITSESLEYSSCCCSTADTIILTQAGLIFDLRSAVERNEDHAQYWMNKHSLPLIQQQQQAPFHVVELDQGVPNNNIVSFINQLFVLHPPNSTRFVVRLDVLNPPLFMQYADEHWLRPHNQAQLLWYKAFDGQKLHEWRMDELNARGLAGLNEAILETGQAKLCQALQLMTLYRESLDSNNNNTDDDADNEDNKRVVIHCVQGKDRTGMLAMLLQSLLGVSDDEIIEDYFLSNASFQKKKEESSAAAAAAAAAATSTSSKGKLDRTIFSGTNRNAMVATLAFLRSKYGSVSPGYLDQIGFNEQWRRRLIAVLTAAHSARLSDVSDTTKNVLEVTSFSSSTLPRSRL